jgi:hypothetical protein
MFLSRSRLFDFANIKDKLPAGTLKNVPKRMVSGWLFGAIARAKI